MGNREDRKPKKVEAQMIPEVATPFLLMVLTSIFKAVISFFTCRWLENLLPKKKKKETINDSNKLEEMVMTNEVLVELVNSDLKNELKHLHFYLQAGVMVSGLHRSELKEFLLGEAASELKHCEQFAELVVYLGGVPVTEPNPFPTDLTCPMAILKHVVEMEREVAEIYAQRIRQTDSIDNAATGYAHVFYEEQIADSQKTAWEVEQMIKKYDHENEKN